MSQSGESMNVPDEMAFKIIQQQLRKALSNNDLYDFAIALDMGADPLCPDDQHVCVYELALATYGCEEFVEQCLKNGCSPHYVNHHLSKAAINYAADSRDPEIIRKLLGYSHVRVNHTFNHLTPLNALALNVNNENANEIIACFESLLEYGASPFIPDQIQMVPKQHILANLDLREDKKKQLLESIELLSTTVCPKDNDLEDAEAQELVVLKQFLNAIKHGDNVTFELLLAQEKPVNYNGSWHKKTPLHQALFSGNSYALKRLLQLPDLQMQAVKCPLILVISNMGEEPGDHRQCFYMLLKSKRIDINECDDWGTTALHSAVLHRNNEAVRELLKRGACIGAKNNSQILALDGMSPELLKECFDNCVTSNGYKMGDTNFEICMNYENLMAPSKQIVKYEEMAPITFIVESKVYRHLIYHPLIISFLFLKWRQLCVLFYTNFLLFVFFAVSVITHTMLKFSEGVNSRSTIMIVWVMSWAGIAYMIIRECLQIVIIPRKYFRSRANYMELTLIALAIMTCVETGFDLQTQRIIAVCLLLLVAMELFLLLGSLPAHSISTHMLMFKVVCKTFLNSFMLYSIFVVTFGFCFYILFGGGRKEGDPVDSSEGDFNKFTNPLTSIVKTIVMLTGEFDAGDIEFKTLYSYTLFLLFVFLMTMVLYNLLNGLAVSDIQAIKGQAKQTGAMCSINFLTRYEQILSGHSERLTFRVNLKRFHPLCRGLMKLYPKNHREGMVADIERNAGKTHFSIDDRRIIKMAMKILEQKTNNSRRQQRMRNNENRFNNIDRRLEEIYEKLENTPT